MGSRLFGTIALISLVISLYVRRRPARGKTSEQDGHTVVAYGLHARGEIFGLREENIKLRQSFE